LRDPQVEPAEWEMLAGSLVGLEVDPLVGLELELEVSE